VFADHYTWAKRMWNSSPPLETAAGFVFSAIINGIERARHRNNARPIKRLPRHATGQTWQSHRMDVLGRAARFGLAR